MQRLITYLLVVLSYGFSAVLAQQTEADNYKVMREGFSNPAGIARPKVYWWCLNGNIDTIRAEQEFLAMKEAGIEGFDLFEIGVSREDPLIPGGPAFLSDESLKIIKFVIDKAGELELSVGLNLASSWNAGGSWTKPEHAGKSLYYSKISIKGNSSGQSIKVPFPQIAFPKASLIGGTDKSLVPFRTDGRPVYYEEVAVLAIPADVKRNSLDTTRIINVSGFFNADTDQLNWKAPPGDWEIHRYVCSNSGQQLVLPSPSSAGLTLDHFDSVAVRTHLMYVINRLKPVIGDFRNTALKSFYLASYEARGFVWTSSLPAEFRKINGYDIYKFLPSIFNPELFHEESVEKLQTDFKKTLSELMINNLYKKAKEICNNHGLKINCEAGGPGYPLYNGPAEPLKALGALDIPRGEFWVNHSRYYKYGDGNDSIDILRVVKEVAAASHIYERGIVEEEAFTSFQHWQEGPVDLKPIGDRAFCEGMNRIVFHGFSHNPTGMGFPGIVYHAGTHFNDKRVWWSKTKPFVDYLSRVSYVFQEAKFVSDVLYYYGDRVPNAVTPKNTRFIAGPGYDYEVINTEILLNNLTVKNGRLLLTNGAEFSILALEDEEVINPAVLIKLNELAEQGAIIIGARPKKPGELVNHPSIGKATEKLIKKLWVDAGDPSNIKPGKKGRIYAGIKPLDMLKVLGVPSDINYHGKESFLLDYIHYQKPGLDFYFIRNTTDEWVSRECGFRQKFMIPEIWDPLTGEVVPVPVYNQDKEYINIPVTLAPYGSYFVVFRKGAQTADYAGIRNDGLHPPLIEFTENGIHFLKEGAFELIHNSGSRKVDNRQKVQVIDGAWNVSFTKDRGAPDSVIIPELASWTSNQIDGIKYYSGIGKYQKTFVYENDTELTEDQRVYIDLGNVAKVAELWLNGTQLGITWTKPFRYDITNYIKNGENLITIEIANTWSNRLTGDAITGEKYTSTNIKVMNRMPWSEIPLIESGLLGPVKIHTVTLVR
jgi:hypothetical protein